ncbi:MAG: acyltransferase domain-containing protein [Lachnospiraceae bacterium]|nr:acyltransferase domain-containing protein [Lachnospiraceae bacterium]MDY5742687.1 acyltransferase domain-containing protein [Lachnospiraceae bacterium]
MMTVHEFWKGIGLMPEAVAEQERQILADAGRCERIYSRSRILFKAEPEMFYRLVLELEQPQLWFLYLYSRMACERFGQYQAVGLPENVFWDTFLDIRLWCENCYRRTGIWGISEYGWFTRHFDGSLYRFGRLEFEYISSPWQFCRRGADGRTEVLVRAGDPVLNIHIPDGDRLSIEAVENSLRQAEAFWGGGLPFVAHSWLLYPGLRELLPPDSNILQFQELFLVTETEIGPREPVERIFDFPSEEMDIRDYPEQTGLQRRAKTYLLSGGKLGCGLGVLLRGGSHRN